MFIFIAFIFFVEIKSPNFLKFFRVIFLGFIVEESPNENIYLQVLDQSLNQSGNSIALSSPATSKQSFDMVLGNDGYVYISEAYFLLKTISVSLHKDGVPKKTLKSISL